MIIVWHEKDLRVEDNKALYEACQKGKILPLFIYHKEDTWEYGGASRWWLHHALEDLQESYKNLGGELLIKKGDPKKILLQLIKEHDIETLHYNLRFEPHLLKRDQEITKELINKGIEVKVFNGNHLIHPELVHNKSGDPYVVFTPFYNSIKKECWDDIATCKAPKSIQTLHGSSEKLKDLGILPDHHWYKKFEQYWDPTRKGALSSLKNFLKGIKEYKRGRDYPAEDFTSKLSPYLHFGQISPFEIVKSLEEAGSHTTVECFFKQLIWREFGMYFLYHHQRADKKNWKEMFDQFPWKSSKNLLSKWQEGKTGYPIVDAGMRQLWKTGWMHNRVRMIVASFLIKDLFIHWREGAAWFWDTLVDADLANNTMGWQWVAGSGPDAAPFFRIFNPVLQGEKFDPEGEYVKTYIPELKDLPKKWIHKPWMAPEAILEEAGISLGKEYPLPIVDHEESRQQALKSYKQLRS